MKKHCTIIDLKKNEPITDCELLTIGEDTVLLGANHIDRIANRLEPQMKVIIKVHESETLIYGFVYIIERTLQLISIGVSKEGIENKRRFVRVSMNETSTVWVKNSYGKRPLDVDVLNISAGGLTIMTKNKVLNLGDVIIYQVEGLMTELFVEGEVIRTEEDGTCVKYGVKFINLKDSDVVKLNTYVLKRIESISLVMVL